LRCAVNGDEVPIIYHSQSSISCRLTPVNGTRSYSIAVSVNDGYQWTMSAQRVTFLTVPWIDEMDPPYLLDNTE
jgi:hypothetical protein